MSINEAIENLEEMRNLSLQDEKKTYCLVLKRDLWQEAIKKIKIVDYNNKQKCFDEIFADFKKICDYLPYSINEKYKKVLLKFKEEICLLSESDYKLLVKKLYLKSIMTVLRILKMK